MAALFPYPCLVADVGGTNARFALAEKPGSELSTPIRLPTGVHHDFADTVHEAIKLGGFCQPRSFLLAAAGAIEDRRLTLSNAVSIQGMLSVDGPSLLRQLDLEQGILLNDFEALSLSLPFLPEQGILSIGTGEAIAGLPQIVVGAGTGLGVGALMQHRGRYLPIASEGGHTALGPETQNDQALWPLLGTGRLSGDDLLSGRGLSKLYGALAKLAGAKMLDAAPAAISSRALAGSEALASQTIDRFLGLLGRFAGDMAITFGAKGGVFIAGGIAPRFATRITASPFRAEFEAKALHQGYMEKIATNLITTADPALFGLSQLAQTPEAFGLDYKNRCWA
jgi:glucokinase